jgi:hypothetical protein
MAKRPGLGSNVKAPNIADQAEKVEALERARQAQDAPAKAAGNHLAEDMTTTAIHVPKTTLALLRRVALARVEKAGKGRASVSSVIADLVETNRTDLEKEVQ